MPTTEIAAAFRRRGSFAALALSLAIALSGLLPATAEAAGRHPARHAVPATATKAKARRAPADPASPNAYRSAAALVVDAQTGETLIEKDADTVRPIASLTKLMTALVVLEGKQPLDETLEIGPNDVDVWRNTYSRLSVGTKLTREQMLLLALMSSENRAALSLSSHYPGGREAFITRMNAKARELGMTSTHFGDPAGLSNDSRSTARDLAKLAAAAWQQPLIRYDSTHEEESVKVRGRTQTFVNTNRLVRGGSWDVRMQKTGFTNDAGHCLIMRVEAAGRHLAMIFLDSAGTLTRYADAKRALGLLGRGGSGSTASAGLKPAALTAQ